MSFYPPKVQNRFDSPRKAAITDGANAFGRSASFKCGSFVSFSFEIDTETKAVTAIGFQSNGCGYMIALADLLAETLKDRQLSELHGLINDDLNSKIDKEIGLFPSGRRQCRDACIEALRTAFADFRTKQIEEFSGEKALVCTCFGVSEETIEMHLRERSVETVDEVTQICNAGGGCGSCRMLIQEMIDSSGFRV